MVYNKTQKVKDKMEGRRERIVKAAREIFTEDSFQNMSIKAIAKKAGIATGTFYLYFTNKEALVETVVKEMYKELMGLIKTERSNYESVFDKLQASMEVCIKVFIREKGIARLLLKHFPEINMAFNNKFTEIEKDLINLVRIDLDELQEQGLIPLQNTSISATAFVGTFRQVILSWLQEGQPENLEEACQTLIQYNMRGLGKIS
ncbi:MAG: TetR family transcriptional regulator [Gracilibacter sp. BRH_c7a]|nr:MAG: TetR family transcriptional regulator [Gracilibacter sp. BRH_c7a]